MSKKAKIQNWLLRLRPFLLYVPAVAAMVGWAVAGGKVNLAGGLGLFSAGLIVWTLLEYGLHRAMHVRPLLPGMGWVQHFHLDHHREPEDLEHAVISLRGSIPLAFLLFLPSWAAFREMGFALVFMAGLITGYLFYEFIHLADHARLRWPIVRQLMRYHARHHHVDEHRTFGVTTPVWDWVFGTLPDRSRVFTPRTQARPASASVSGRSAA